jgi:hypothetical protein
VRTNSITLALLACLSTAAAGCGVAQQGGSPVVVRIATLDAASGAKPDAFSGTLNSDVITIVTKDKVSVATIFDDFARVGMQLALKDPGAPGVTNVPSPTNAVTFTHYHVVFRRTDGHNIEGVDVPYAFTSGLTFSVPPDGTVTASFEIVRHAAKEDSPLKALQFTAQIIYTIADITFYGKDQTNHDVAVTGSIGVAFGNFGDPAS